ncbi:MAG: primosomal protein N' [Clostridia bacterium]|nr:primosomal protein N' [Clostridia bacterium]
MEKQEIFWYAVVHIIDTPYHVDRPFTYYVPCEISEEGSERVPYMDVHPGCFVLVPFGGGNRKVMGIVTAMKTREELEKEKSIDPAKCKPVDRVLSPEFALDETMLGLCGYLSEMTFCTIGDAAKAVVPVGSLKRITDVYTAVPGRTSDFEEKYGTRDMLERKVWEYVSLHKSVRREKLISVFGDDAPKTAEHLRRQGFLVKHEELSGGDNVLYTVYVRPIIGEDDLNLLLSSDKETRKKYGLRAKNEGYQKLFSLLLENGETEESTLLSEGISKTVISGAERAGILAKREELCYRNPYAQAAKAAPADGNILNDEQEAAREVLSGLYRSGEAKAALLHGVTGSGKTRVIKAMMDEVIADGRQVIMLVPEISLTPQSVAIFCAYYGERVAVVHSGLSAGERLDVWRRAKHHDVDLVIGTRSAVFTPFDNLGMIVIDEEQEHTYKSDITPKYHARDAARYRCAADKALLLLASATPSFESYYKARSGVYTLVELKKRYGGAALPDVIMADLHEDGDITGETPLGNTMASALAETKANGEQAVMFVNRRGYQKYISCLVCKEPVMCPHCSVPMTLHKAGQAGASVLVCHYCGTRAAPPEKCPACGSDHLRAFGYGTQRAEQEIAERFPEIRTLRMDMDTTQGKFAHEEILGKFREKEADLLLGTQMVTKGHDFPDVTLVGVLGADAMLFQDDYRASERAFSLITQVIGRAGRSGKRGRAVIQTYNPDHEILRFAAAQNYSAFYDSAIGIRRAMIFPPFCDMISIGFSSAEEAEVMNAASKMSKRITELKEKDYKDVQMLVFGPFEAQIYRLKEQFRMRMILKCRMNKRTREMVTVLMKEFSALCSGRVTLSVDVNPTNL